MKHPVEQIAEACGGTITEAGSLPGGSGFAIMTMPLKPTHWIYNQDDSINSGPPPMPFRMGLDDQATLLIQRKATATPFGGAATRMSRGEFSEKVLAAARYAVRASTMCGKEMDFDPDALARNMVVGMLGYRTESGLSSDEWENPKLETE